MDPLLMFFLTGIVIMAFLFWWTFRTRAGRRWLNGDDEEDDKK